jgi:4-hydroxybenzoate polyprenyltransferase
VNADLETVPDSERRGLIGALPPALRPFASLMRLDRPIGTWLLYWPCTCTLEVRRGLRGLVGSGLHGFFE